NKIIVTIPEDLTLTETERTVLKKGLTFVPTKNTTNEYQVKADCEKFYRRLRLKAHFHGQDNEPTDDPFAKFNNKISTWTPPQGEFSAIDHYIDRCRRIVNSINFKRPVKVTNLTEEEKTALKHLRQRKDIVIKPADKGGAVVVWSRPLYIQEANRQLSDARFYQHLSHDPLKEYQKTIKSVVNEMIANVELPPSAKHLIVTSARTSRFYLLPKIHKPNNPGRPIVSACNCPTQDISAFLDEIMAPFVKSLPSYVKDTNDALNIFDAFRFNSNNSNTAGRFLFTMDIKSLYTVIPNDGGLQALTYYLDQRLVKEPPTHTLTRLAELVLTLNAFSFNGQIYHQTGGVAMGTKMGPNYACLYVGYFEDQVFRQYTGFVPQLYRRYIDDVIGAASCNREELEGFIDFVSNFNPALQFTYTITERELPFLDITLRIDHDRLQTSVFYKETATHNYLHYNSSHPSHCKRSIPYSQFLRLRRLCSDNNDFLARSTEMKTFFIHRGYLSSSLDDDLRKIMSIDRQDALVPRQSVNNETQERVPLVLTYHPLTTNIKRILLENFTILSNDPLTKGATVLRDPDTGCITVARILHGGVVDRSGTLQVGDVIQEINGKSVHGKTTDEVVEIMEKLLGSVMFKVFPAMQDAKLQNESKTRLRALFDYDPTTDDLIPCKEAGKTFKKADILHIVSRDDPNWWQRTIRFATAHYSLYQSALFALPQRTIRFATAHYSLCHSALFALPQRTIRFATAHYSVSGVDTTYPVDKAREEGAYGTSIGLIPSKQFQEKRVLFDKLMITEKENHNRKDGRMFAIRSIIHFKTRRRKSRTISEDVDKHQSGKISKRKEKKREEEEGREGLRKGGWEGRKERGKEGRREGGKEGRKEEGRMKGGREGWMEGRMDGGKEGRKREGGKEGRKEGRMKGGREGWMEGRMDGGKEGRRERRKEGGKDERGKGRMDGGKDGWREEGKEGGKEGRMDGGKEGWREGGKEGREGKEGRREGGKDGWRDGGKEGRKREGGKEGRREGGKEDGWMDGWMEGRMDRGKEGRREGWMEGRREGRGKEGRKREGGKEGRKRGENDIMPRPLGRDSGPRGVGRNELKKRLLASDHERFATAVPHTSRRMRPYETDGREYNFVSRTTMENYDHNNKFIEYGEHRKCLYGTSIDSIKRVLKTGKICIIKIQPQAIKTLRHKEYKPYIVYIKPPPLEKLRATRLTIKSKADKKQGQRAFKEDDLQEMIKAGEAIEREYGHYFDEIIVNDDLQVAYFELNNAIERVTRETLWVPAEWQ
ncbi:hypothetical protein QZH41_013536, partial [Actinostola sp. cb2023]